MSRKDVMGNVKLSKFEDLFHGNGTGDTEQSVMDVKEIAITKLHEFRNHPFKIRSDEELAEMIESVKEHGVLVPGIVRERKEGGYEIIAGHTRRHVCELLGMETMPMIIRDISDDEACVMMVDSNIQREDILPSEKAKAYMMKYNSMKNQGKAGNSLKQMEEENGENYKTIQRYIWLARLSDDFLNLLDEKCLGMSQGIALSGLTELEQDMVYQVITDRNVKLSIVQAETIKQLAKDGKLERKTLERYFDSAKEHLKPEKKEITLKQPWLEQFFGEEYSTEQMMDIIRELLLDWKENGDE